MKLKTIYIIFACCILYTCGNSKQVEVLDGSNSLLSLKNGVLYYNELPFAGALVSYYSKEQLKSEVHYLKGKKHGQEKKWYANNDLAEVRFYINGNKSGTHKAWWSNNSEKFVYHFNEKGEYHGEVLEWYKTGQVFKAFNYINGKEVGSQQLWQINGKIKGNYEVVNGERFGLIGLKKCYAVTTNSDEVN